MSEERKGQPWDAYMREHGEEEYAMSDTEKWLAVLRNNRERWPSVSLAMVDQDRLLAELDARDAEIARLKADFMAAQANVSTLEVMARRTEGLINAHYERAEKAEAERDAAQQRIAALTEALREIHAAGCDCISTAGITEVCGACLADAALAAVKGKHDGE